jgi:2-C-methyl-D-erythritol 4-phosphate cytidylyltransferase
MGGEPKAFIEILGRPMLSHSLDALDRCEDVTRVVVVLPADRLSEGRALAESAVSSKPISVCAGGATRRASVLAGLEATDAVEPWTLVHDAARPCLTENLISAGLQTARATGAVTAAIPSQDTVKEVGPGGAVLRTLDRSTLYMTQTPQVFATEALKHAHREAPPEMLLDDASLLEVVGYPVHVYEGDPLNIKVTTAADLRIVESILQSRGVTRGPGADRA